jgi:low temperature requirement protein LtrA
VNPHPEPSISTLPFRAPRLRTLMPEGHERHASWLELFFDLVIVLAIAQVAHTFVHHPDWQGVLTAAGLFIAIFLGWQGFSFYADRFDTDDILFRIATFGQMFALLVLAMQVGDVAEGHPQGFALAFAALRAILVLLYFNIYRAVEVARPLARRYGTAYGISVLLWLISVFVPAPWSFGLWAIAILLDLSMPWVSMPLHRAIPTDPEHVPERFGLFTIIVLGELVVAVGVGTESAVWSAQAVLVAIACSIIAATLWWIYFDRPGEYPLAHVPVRIVTYAYAHLPLLGGLMFVAGGVNLLITHADEGHAGAAAWALCGGISLVLLALLLADGQLVGVPMRPLFWARGAVILALLLLALRQPPALILVWLVAAALVATVVGEEILCRRAARMLSAA